MQVCISRGGELKTKSVTDLHAAIFQHDPALSNNSGGEEKNNPESFKSSTQYSLSLSFKVLYNLINRIKVIR